MLNTQTKLYAILGYPIKHSLSPQMHNIWFKKENLNCAYLAFKPTSQDFKKTVESLKLLKFQGLNITIPYKIEIIKYIDFLDKNAAKIGSVNTVSIKKNKLYGYNTDYLGFLQDLHDKKIALKNKKVLVVGAGGSTRAIIYALQKAQVRDIYITNRTKKKAQALGEIFALDVIDINKVTALLPDIDLLVNTSACGMKKDDKLPFSVTKVKKSLIIYDLIYGKITPFTKIAKQKGLEIITGEGMLAKQGAHAFKAWTGKYPDVKVVERSLQNP